MPSLLKFRTMRLADLDVVFAIENEQEFPWTRQMLSDCLQANYICIVAMLDELIIGYAILMGAIDEAEVLNIVIAKNHRGQGYGKLLLQHLISLAENKKLTKIFLEVRASNFAAIKLYESCDFAKINIRKNYYKNSTGREDALVFKWGVVLNQRKAH